MTIQIQQPELEALIHERLSTGAFRDVEDVLLQALKAAPAISTSLPRHEGLTGGDLIAALQSCPYPDAINQPERYSMPVREPEVF